MAISSKPARRVLTRDAEENVVRNAEPKQGKKWRRRLVFSTLTLALLVWFLPIILAKTPLLGWAINRFGNLKGHVAVQSASLGWFSPPAISGIELRDEQNQPVLDVSEVSGSQSLLSLVYNSSKLGCFHIEKPKLTLRLRPDGSNLEDVIAGYMTGEPSSKKIGLEIDIKDATIEIVDEAAKRSRILDQFSVNLKMPASDAEPMIVNITSGRFVDPTKPGNLTAKVRLHTLALPQANDLAKGGEADEITLHAENLPLDIVQPVLGRFVSQTQLTGWLSADIRSTPAENGAAGKTAVQGTASAENFAFAMPAFGKDQIRLTSLRAEGKGAIGGNQIDIENSSLTCDLGNAQLAGSMQLQDGDGKSNLSAAGLLRQRCVMSGRVDLARLAAMLPNLLQIRQQTQITSGEVQMRYAYEPQGADPKSAVLAWHGECQAANIAANDNGRKLAWAKPIVVGFAAHEEPRGIIVDALQCDSDFLKISANGTTDDLTASATFDLKQLADQLGQFVEIGQYQLAGKGWANVNLKRDDKQKFEGDAKIHVDQLSLNSPSIYLAEPQLDFSAAGSWNSTGRQLALQSASLTNGTINATASDFVLSMPEKGPLELAGTVQYRGNLDRLQQCFADRTKPATWGIGGVIAGGAQFKQTGGIIRCETAADVTDLVVADASGQQFQEPIIKVAATGDYDNGTGLVKIDQATISSTFIAANSNAALGMKEQPLNKIDGQVSYDLNRISGLLRPSFGNKVRFAGQGTGPIAWRGPLTLAGGQAAAELKWDSAYLYGFHIGPATVRPKLEGGMLAIEPMQVAVSRGKLFLAPKVRLAPEPKELTMPAGPLAEKVQITPDMCDMFLKYIAPVLADVADARGEFSIVLTRCRLPISDPTMGELAGNFIVHNVEIGPGPLIREMAILMDRETPAKLRQESSVAFNMRGGRVYHENMELLFPDFTIRTRGSVGINDQTLSVVAEMPVPPKWLVNNPAASALKGQTLALPIGGTLSHPQLDQAKLQEYTERFIRKAAGNLIEDGIKNGLDQLFRKPGQ
jgi:hypothetical protein